MREQNTYTTGEQHATMNKKMTVGILRRLIRESIHQLIRENPTNRRPNADVSAGMINDITKEFAPQYMAALNSQRGKNYNLDYCMSAMRGDIMSAKNPGWKPLQSSNFHGARLVDTTGLDWIGDYMAAVQEYIDVDSQRDFDSEREQQYGTGLTRGLGT